MNSSVMFFENENEELELAVQTITTEQGIRNWATLLAKKIVDGSLTRDAANAGSWPFFELYSAFLGIPLTNLQIEQLSCYCMDLKWKVRDAIEVVMTTNLDANPNHDLLKEIKLLRAFPLIILYSSVSSEFSIRCSFTGRQEVPKFTLNFHHHYRSEVSTCTDYSFLAPLELNKNFVITGASETLTAYDGYENEYPEMFETSSGQVSPMAFSPNLWIRPIVTDRILDPLEFFKTEIKLIFEKTIFFPTPETSLEEIISRYSDGIFKEFVNLWFAHTDFLPVSGPPALYAPSLNLSSRGFSESEISTALNESVIRPMIALSNIFLRSISQAARDGKLLIESTTILTEDLSRGFTGALPGLDRLQPDYIIRLNNDVPLFTFEVKRKLGVDICGSLTDDNGIMRPLSNETRSVLLQTISQMLSIKCCFGVVGDLFNAVIIILKDVELITKQNPEDSIEETLRKKLGIHDVGDGLKGMSDDQILSIVDLQMMPLNISGTVSDDVSDRGGQTLPLKFALMCLTVKAIVDIVGLEAFQNPEEFDRLLIDTSTSKICSNGYRSPLQSSLPPSSNRSNSINGVLSKAADTLRPTRRDQIEIVERFLSFYEVSNSSPVLITVRSSDDSSFVESRDFPTPVDSNVLVFELGLVEFYQSFGGAFDFISQIQTSDQKSVKVRLEIYDLVRFFQDNIRDCIDHDEDELQYCCEDENSLKIFEKYYASEFMREIEKYKSFLENIRRHNMNIYKSTIVSSYTSSNSASSLGSHDEGFINSPQLLLNGELIMLFDEKQKSMIGAGYCFASLEPQQVVSPINSSSTGSGSVVISTSSTLSQEEENALTVKVESQLRNMANIGYYPTDTSQLKMKLRVSNSEINTARGDGDEPVDVILPELEPFFPDLRLFSKTPRLYTVPDSHIKADSLRVRDSLLAELYSR